MASTRLQRKEIHYSGHVQGVGFRYTTQRIASGFEVIGFVKNLSDGRVQLLVEAEPAEMKRFLREIDDRLGEFIRDKSVAECAASGEFAGFSIHW